MKNIHRAWAVCLGCTLALLVCGGTYTGYRLRNRKTRA